jgi:hypothetical protein
VLREHQDDPRLDSRALDAALQGEARDFRTYRGALLEALAPAALSRAPADGRAVSARLGRPGAAGELAAFGGKYRLPRARADRWYLLWALGRNGHGRVDPSLLALPWDQAPNGPEKYFHPTPAAAWVAAWLGQDDDDTLSALMARLGHPDDPGWLVGDLVGALSMLTGLRHGYDIDAWRQWWSTRH